MVFSFISSSFLSLVSSEVEDSLSEFELVDEPAKIYLLHIFEANQSHKSLVRFVAPLSTLTANILGFGTAIFNTICI